MALSYIDEVPPGRLPIKTVVYKQKNEEDRQHAYVITISLDHDLSLSLSFSYDRIPGIAKY